MCLRGSTDPEFDFFPGTSDNYEYPNNQEPTTLWFHDHSLGITRLNVTMGMAAFYLLRDSYENCLIAPNQLPSGPNELGLACSFPPTRVAWSVNGLPGGDSTVGTITPEGRYTAPVNVPPGGTVAVRPALETDPTVVGEATVQILPTPIIPGRTRVLASIGGTVPSEEGDASLAIPPGALPANTEVTIESLVGPSQPAPEPGRRVLGAVRHAPAGLVFNVPVAVTFPLARFILPGTHLPVSLVDPTTGAFVRNEGIIATVLEDGSHAHQ